MLNMTKNELFEALQKSISQYDQLCRQLRTLNMRNPESRILVIELPPMILYERRKIRSLKYYYKNFEKNQRIARQEQRSL